MSIYIRVGSEVVQLSGPSSGDGASEATPFPAEILEQEVAQSRLRQRGAAEDPPTYPQILDAAIRGGVEAIRRISVEASEVLARTALVRTTPAELDAIVEGRREVVPDAVVQERLHQEVDRVTAARRPSEVREGAFAPIDEADVPVAERAYNAGKAAASLFVAINVRMVVRGVMAELDQQGTIHAYAAVVAERVAERLTAGEAGVVVTRDPVVDHGLATDKALYDQLVDAGVARAASMFSGELVTADDARTAGRPTYDQLSDAAEKDQFVKAAIADRVEEISPARRYVDKRPRPVVTAVQWTGDNWDALREWLSPRVGSVVLEETDRAWVVVAHDDDGYMRCRPGGWFIQRQDGSIFSREDTAFRDQYEPVDNPQERGPEVGALKLLVAWRRWARALLKEPGVAARDDGEMRRKISAVIEAPSVIEAEALPHDQLVIEACARVANDVYREMLNGGEMPSWDDANDHQKSVARDTVQAALVGTTPEQWHARWSDEKRADGWRYDPIKSDEQKLHPNLVPYSQLPAGQRALDSLFLTAVKATRRAITELEVATFAPVLRLKGDIPPGQFDEFKKQWNRQVAGLGDAWKTPILNVGDTEFIPRSRSQLDMVEFVDGLITSMLDTPEPWGTLREVELQVLLLLEVRAFELAGKPGPDSVVIAFERFVRATVGDDMSAESLSTQLEARGRAGEFTALMGEFAATQRAAFVPIPASIHRMLNSPTDVELVALFEKHCECRPVNTVRVSHSHDCDTGITDDVRTVLHRVVVAGPDEAITGIDGSPYLRVAADGEVSAAIARLAEIPRPGS